jgi:cadmium resistance protein CadD (predicted permease)
VLERWEHMILPIALIGIGVAVLVEGGACGL